MNAIVDWLLATLTALSQNHHSLTRKPVGSTLKLWILNTLLEAKAFEYWKICRVFWPFEYDVCFGVWYSNSVRNFKDQRFKCWTQNRPVLLCFRYLDFQCIVYTNVSLH